MNKLKKLIERFLIIGISISIGITYAVGNVTCTYPMDFNANNYGGEAAQFPSDLAINNLGEVMTTGSSNFWQGDFDIPTAGLWFHLAGILSPNMALKDVKDAKEVSDAGSTQKSPISLPNGDFVYISSDGTDSMIRVDMPSGALSSYPVGMPGYAAIKRNIFETLGEKSKAFLNLCVFSILPIQAYAETDVFVASLEKDSNFYLPLTLVKFQSLNLRDKA